MPDLDFNQQNSLFATHGLHAFAAKCPPQLVRYGIKYYTKIGERILDPMMGSGTTLVQSRLMGRNSTGYDIDPLARLIAKVKSTRVSDSCIEEASVRVIKRVLKDMSTLESQTRSAAARARATPPDFPNRDYWFTPKTSATLALLSYHIDDTVAASSVRNFLWVAFSSLILAKTSVANARDIIHSRHHFWEHPKEADVMARFEARMKVMRRQMLEFSRLCEKVQSTSTYALLGDARSLRTRDESFDLVFTSPPYATALDYPRAHFLAVAWMQRVLGVDLETYLTRAPNYVGSERGKRQKSSEAVSSLEKGALALSVIRNLSKRAPTQARLTQRYFVDMNKVLFQISRVLKPRRHAIVVVCPSHIRKVSVPTHEVLIESAREHRLVLKQQCIRKISERRRILPYMKKSFGKRMATEYVLIFQKTS